MRSSAKPDAADQTPPEAIRVLRASELLRAHPVRWVVRPLIEYGARGVVYGPSGAGKTFLTLDLALSIAAGAAWCASSGDITKTAHGPVLFVCAEGPRSLERRVQGWLEYHALDVDAIDTTFHAIGTPVQLLEPAQTEDLFHAIRAVVPACPVLIVVDTLAWSMLGYDENDSGVMTRLISETGRLQRRLADAYETSDEPAALFVHHTGKNEKAIRGAYALQAAADFMLRYVGKGTRGHLTCEKMRDGARVAPLVFRHRAARIGEDEDGKPLTTCVATFEGVSDDHTPDTLTRAQVCVVDALQHQPPIPVKLLMRRMGKKHETAVRRPLQELVDLGIVQKTLGKDAHHGTALYSLVSHTHTPQTGNVDCVGTEPLTPPHALHTHPLSLLGEGCGVSGVCGAGGKRGVDDRARFPPIELGRFASLSPDDADEDPNRDYVESELAQPSQ